MANVWVRTNKVGTIYTLKRAIAEVQVISGQLDPELVPRKSVAEHISLSCFEVGSLLNQLCAPWYGVTLPITLLDGSTTTKGEIYKFYINTFDNGATPSDGSAVTTGLPDDNGALGLPVFLPRPWVSGISDAASQPNIEKIVAVINDDSGAGYVDTTGTVKQARDISQFWGLAKGGNTQWQKSIVWVQHGNIIYLWKGGEITVPGVADSNRNIYIQAYRSPAPLDPTNDNDIMDLPDKYAPLVISKAALLCLKQAKVGNYQEQEGQVQQQVAQLSAEYDKGMSRIMQSSQLEGIQQG